jgi:hypothetical protein
MAHGVRLVVDIKEIELQVVIANERKRRNALGTQCNMTATLVRIGSNVKN